MKQLAIASVIAVSLIGASVASAQEGTGTYYPGVFWTSNGTVSPVEKGNIVSMSHAEQGIAKRGAELFVQSTAQYDSKGYDWNRRVIGGIGARFTQSIGTGMVRVGVSYLSERRFVVPKTTSGFSVTAEAWFGWKQHAPLNVPRR